MIPSKLLRFSICVGIVSLLIGMNGCSAPPITDKPDGAPGNTLTLKESPMLTQLVDEGKLPSLAQRLPDDPLVVKPLDSPGEYGGTWHFMVDNPDLGPWKMVGGYAPLMRWNRTASGLSPGLAKSWEFSKDGSVLTIHLRHGVKWSDGAPYTSDDLAYWAEISANKDSQLTRPYWTLVHGVDMTYSCPDKYTFVMKFAGPNWYAPLHMATGFWESDNYEIPKHYMMQFDPKYNPKYKDYSIFDNENQSSFNPARPSLWPWHLASIEAGGFRMVFERNPYYYMTDTQGRQLPYIDKVICSYVPDPQVQVLEILSGAIDCQIRLMQARDYSLYVEGQKRGHYKVLKWATDNGADVAFMLNWSPDDPVLRSLIRDVRFRKALSLAIDRNKCNEIAWRGLATPQQATISKDAWHFKAPGGAKVYADWARAGAEFDIPQANALLDSMGLKKRNAEGTRLRPDGKPLTLLLDLPPAASQDISVDESQIAVDGWRQLGIDIDERNWPSAQFTLRQSLGTFEISSMPEAEMDLFTFPDWVFPTTNQRWHAKIGEWYSSGGKKGEKPTGIMKQLLGIYDQIQGEGDINKAHQLVLKAIRLETKEGYFALGTAANDPALVMVKDNFKNTPNSGVILGPWEIATPAAIYPETFYFSSKPSDNPGPKGSGS